MVLLPQQKNSLIMTCFLYYLEKDYDGKTIEIVNQTVRDIIYDYIAIHRSSKEEQALDKVASDWQSYTKKIEVSKSPFAKKTNSTFSLLGV